MTGWAGGFHVVESRRVFLVDVLLLSSTKKTLLFHLLWEKGKALLPDRLSLSARLKDWEGRLLMSRRLFTHGQGQAPSQSTADGSRAGAEKQQNRQHLLPAIQLITPDAGRIPHALGSRDGIGMENGWPEQRDEQ